MSTALPDPRTRADAYVNSSADVERYDKPHAGYSQTVSPLSPRNQGKIQAMSLGISPLVGPSTSGLPPVSTTKSQQKLPSLNLAAISPTPIAIHQLGNIPELNPRIDTSSIEKRLHSQAVAINEVHPSNRQLTSLFDLPAMNLDRSSQPHPFRPTVAQIVSQAQKYPLITNPYTDRADEIGPSHGIPGVGHIGNMLTPPGWIEGSEPLSPGKIRQLYEASRRSAQQNLAKDLEFKNTDPSDTGRGERDAVRNRDWKASYMLDNLLRKERNTVHEMHRGYGGILAPREVLCAPRLVPGQNPRPLSKLDPRGESYSQSLLSPSFDLPKRSDLGIQGIPQSGFASPTALNSSLPTETLYIMSARHAAEKDRLEHQLLERERSLSAFLAQHGHHFSHNPMSPGIRAPVSNQQNSSFAPTQTSNFGTFPRPLPFVSPTTSAFSNLPLPSHSCNVTQPFPQESEALQTMRHASASQSQPSWIDSNTITKVYGNHQTNHKFSSQQTSLGSSPALTDKKRNARKKPEKQPVRSPDQMANADLPTSVISRKALEVGLSYDKLETTPKKSKGKRARKEPVDPGQPVKYIMSLDASAKMLEQWKNGTLHPGLAKVMPKNLASSVTKAQQPLHAEASVPARVAYVSPQQVSTDRPEVNIEFPAHARSNISGGETGTSVVGGLADSMFNSSLGGFDRMVSSGRKRKSNSPVSGGKRLRTSNDVQHLDSVLNPVSPSVLDLLGPSGN